MAAPAVIVVSNSRLSGTDAKPLKIVTFSEDLSHPGVHHTTVLQISDIAHTVSAIARQGAIYRISISMPSTQAAPRPLHTPVVHTDL